jgi:hypothetical protein
MADSEDLPEDEETSMTVTSPPNDGARPIAPPLIFETLKVSREGAVLFAEIAAPPMNLLGPELVRTGAR